MASDPAMQPERINDDDSDRLVAKLERFHRWYFPQDLLDGAEGRGAPSRHLPPALAWALRHSARFEHHILANLESDGRIHCFNECGYVFGGYFAVTGDPVSDLNPLVSFEFLGGPTEHAPMRLNDLIVGAYFEGIAMRAYEMDQPGTVPSDEHLIWSGTYLWGPERVWVDGDLVVLDFGDVFDGPVACARLSLDMSADIESLYIGVPDSVFLKGVHLRKGRNLHVDRYRPGPQVGPDGPGAATAWADIRHLQAHAIGWQPAGTVVIPWTKLAPLWRVITNDLPPASYGSDAVLVTVHRVGADISYSAEVTGQAALAAMAKLRRLVRKATEIV